MTMKHLLWIQLQLVTIYYCPIAHHDLRPTYGKVAMRVCFVGLLGSLSQSQCRLPTQTLWFRLLSTTPATSSTHALKRGFYR